jgi:cystathionine beta-synthase
MKELVGHTPIVRLKSNIADVNLYAKCEFMNPTGSIKDRVAVYIIEKLTKEGKLKKNQLIVESSSGNMGTSLAAFAQQYGHPVHITCPEKTGMLKRKLIQAYYAKLTVCPNTTDSNHPDFYVNKAREIALKYDGYFINQYDNPLNTECHYHTTGQEIVDYCTQKRIALDYFITVGGSGGTITGCAKKIKEKFGNTKVVMPDPSGSVYYDLYHHGKVIKENIKSYKAEGPGNPVYCESMDFSYIDDIVKFNDQDAFSGCHLLTKEQGVLAGHSSGANYHIANKIIRTKKSKKPLNILILLPDSGVKYL